MKETLAEGTVRTQLLDRLARLTPTSSRQWGTLSAPEMLRHLIDSFDGCTGRRMLSPKSTFLSRTLFRYVALRLPMKWPPGYPTAREADPRREGTRPGDFEEDRRMLATMIQTLGENPKSVPWTSHPGFGEMSEWEWMRWSYLHVDHHLRQFGL